MYLYFPNGQEEAHAGIEVMLMQHGSVQCCSVYSTKIQSALKKKQITFLTGIIFILTLISCYFISSGTSAAFILLYRKTELYGFREKKINTANNVLVGFLYNAQFCHYCPRSLTHAVVHALPFLLI